MGPYRPGASGSINQLPKDQIFPDIKPDQSIDEAPGQGYRAGDSRAPTDVDQQMGENINENKGEGESIAFSTSAKDRQATQRLNVEGPHRQTEAPSAFMSTAAENAKPGVTNRDIDVNTDAGDDVNQRDSTAFMAQDRDQGVQNENKFEYTKQDAPSVPGFDAPVDKDINQSAYNADQRNVRQQRATDNDTSAYDKTNQSDDSSLGDSVKQYASDIKETMKDKSENIAEKAGEYWDDYKAKVSDVKHAAQDKVHDMKETITEKKDEWMDKASDMKETASDKTSDTMEKIKEMPHLIKEKIKDYTGIGKRH